MSTAYKRARSFFYLKFKKRIKNKTPLRIHNRCAASTLQRNNPSYINSLLLQWGPRVSLPAKWTRALWITKALHLESCFVYISNNNIKRRGSLFWCFPPLLTPTRVTGQMSRGVWRTQKGLFLPLSLLAFGTSFNSFSSNLFPRISSSFSLHPLLLIVNLYFSFQLSSLCKWLKFKSSLLNCIWSQASISNCLLDIPASCPTGTSSSTGKQSRCIT